MFERIQQRLRAQPFVPFEIRLPNGEAYHIPHPECAALTPFVVVVTDLESGQITECALDHVASVERVPAAEAPTSV
jgi:hypothetical protein